MGLLQTIKKKFCNYFTHQHGLVHKPKYEVMPVPGIGHKQLQNGKLLSTRKQLLAILPQNGRAAEFVVDHGDFSRKILEINQPATLHLINVWKISDIPRSYSIR